jgi:hypothetical protein
MSETLLTQSAVKMYGRVLKGVKLEALAPGDSSDLGFNKFLKHQLVDQKFEGKIAVDPATLARIYAFSFEGAFYNLPRPAIFLVHGLGKPIIGSGTYDESGGINAGNPVMDHSGIPAREFVFETDVRYWEYDKDDLSLRLDSFSGTLEDILIEAALSSTSRSGILSRSGIQARSGVTSDADESMRHRLR